MKNLRTKIFQQAKTMSYKAEYKNISVNIGSVELKRTAD
jgi:hypothetical protein